MYIEDRTHLLAFFDTTVAAARFELERVPVSIQDAWSYRGGALSHRTGAYFNVTGLTHERTGIVEEHLVLYQPQGAINGLALHRTDAGDIHLLLQARVEPGNPGVCQLGPTVQSTPGNYLRLHGGKATPFLECFFGHHPGAQPLIKTMQLDHGTWYYQKTKAFTFVELTEMTEPGENLAWIPLHVVNGLLHEDFLINTDLRAMLGVFDWDAYAHPEAAAPPSPYLSLAAGWQPAAETRGSVHLIPLESLTQWKATDDGIHSTTGANVSLGMYRVRSDNREVAQWYQPLLEAATPGRVVLKLRRRDGQYDLLLTLSHDLGAPGRSIIHPTQVVDAGGTQPLPPLDERTPIAVLQSDEGGRFQQMISRFEVQLVEDAAPAPGQRWVSTKTFRALCLSSNLLSLQLRTMTSIVLPYLHPNTFTEPICKPATA